MLQFCGLLVIIGLIAAIICLASKNGKQAARLKDLKRELDAIDRSQKLAANVYSLPPDDARRLLHDVANGQQR